MKLLIVTPYPMLPLSHGGRVRTYRLAVEMARSGADVDLVCPWSPGQPRHEYRQEGVRCLPRLFAVSPLLAVSDDWLPSAVPVSWQPVLPEGRRILREAEAYDVVQFEACGYGSWMTRLAPGLKRVYASPNVEGDLAWGRARGSGRRRRMAERVVGLESKAVRTSDLVIACTDADARRFQDLYGAGIRANVVPNGFDDSLLGTDWAALRTRAREDLDLRSGDRAVLFIGGAADHNRQAVRFLTESLLARLPSTTRLLIAGKAADAVSRPQSAAVRALGFVDDLTPLLAAADLAVNPVTYGSGSNLKMAEYLAAGLPVISTPIGARGFERYDALVRIAPLEELAGAIEAAPPRDGPPPGIEELGWAALGKRLHRSYVELLGR